MKKIFKSLAVVTAAATFTLTLAACGGSSATTTTAEATTTPAATTTEVTTTAAPKETTTVAPEETTTVAPEETTTVEPEPTTTDDYTGPNFTVGKGASEYTAFANYEGYGKSTDYEITDLYVNLSVKFDYSLGGYSISGAYACDGSNNTYNYQQYFIVDGENLYEELSALCASGYNQVTDEMITILTKLAISYFGEKYESYWNYFTFIKEDACPYQQLVDSTGWCKVGNFTYKDLYVTPYSGLTYVFGYYNLASENYYYHNSYFVDANTGEDYYALIESKLDENGYAKVDDDILRALKYLASVQYNGYDNAEGYYYMYCSVKTSDIPEAEYETVVTEDYYQELEKVVGHDGYVQQTAELETIMQGIASTYYGAAYASYSDDFTFVKTSFLPSETYTAATADTADDAELYINLSAGLDCLYSSYYNYYYSLADYYSYKASYGDDYDYFKYTKKDNTTGNYYEDLVALMGENTSGYILVTDEMKAILPNIASALSVTSYKSLCFTKETAEYDTEYVSLRDVNYKYRTVSYTTTDLYISLDAKLDYFGYSLSELYASYPSRFQVTEQVLKTE